MQTKITVCDTCRCDKEQAQDVKRDGEKLAELIEHVAQEYSELQVVRHSCLMGCDYACNVAIQGADKLNYVLGGFAPEKQTAAGIVEYALAYHQSETGQVPFKSWPSAIKGHFRARIPAFDTET